ncbi:hypothetical protein KM043_016372 [Ampulex compressa]|nr:hypothetical protein KM043_016372 [Ampulex compressa]
MKDWKLNRQKRKRSTHENRSSRVIPKSLEASIALMVGTSTYQRRTLELRASINPNNYHYRMAPDSTAKAELLSEPYKAIDASRWNLLHPICAWLHELRGTYDISKK